MSKKLEVAILALVLVVLTTSITSFIFYKQDKKAIEAIQLEKENKLLDRISALEKDLEDIKEENSILNKKIYNLQDGIVRTNNLIQEQVEIINLRDNKNFIAKNLVLPIYTANIDTYEKEIKFYIPVLRSL